MADTLTTNIKLTNQTEGGNNNTWGQIADDNFERIDNKFGDVTIISTSGGTTTLSDTQEIANAIRVSGSLSSNAVVQFSSRGGTWVVSNQTSGSYTVACKVTGQTGVVVPQGVTRVIHFNGSDIEFANPPEETPSEVTLSASSTTDVLGQESDNILITGSATITSLGSAANKTKFCVAGSVMVLQHHDYNLACPGATNLHLNAADTFIAKSNSAGQVRIFATQRYSPPIVVPIGTVLDFAGGSAPPVGWLWCYGQAVSRATYSYLFAVIGIGYGSGDGSTTFNLPDLRGRVVAGRDDMGGSAAGRLTSGASGLNGSLLGAPGGAETVTISQANLPAVNLPSSGLSAASSTSVTIGGATKGGTGTAGWGSDGGGLTGPVNPADITASASTTTSISGTVPLGGSGNAVNNVQPTIVLNKIIYAGP